MKIKSRLFVGVVFASSLTFSVGQDANPSPGAPTTLPGMIAEDGDLNLEAAIRSYQSVISDFDGRRAEAAKAIFRLGECYRKLGRMEEAKVQYGRILREFLDYSDIVTLSRKQLFPDDRYSPAMSSSLVNGLQDGARTVGSADLQQRISVLQNQIDEMRSLVQSGRASASGLEKMNQELESLKGQLAARKAREKEQRDLLEQELKLLDEQLASTQLMVDAGREPKDSLAPLQVEVLHLRQRMADLDRAGGAIADDDWRLQKKQLVEEEMKIREHQKMIAQKQIERGVTPTNSLMSIEREILQLRRNLIDIDQRPDAVIDATPSALPSPSAVPVPARAENPELAALKKEAADAEQAVLAAKALVRQRSEILEIVQSMAPDLWPDIARDERYRQLKQQYENALLGEGQTRGDKEAADRALNRLQTWAKTVRIPEIRAELDAALIIAERAGSEWVAINQRIKNVEEKLHQDQEQNSQRKK